MPERFAYEPDGEVLRRFFWDRGIVSIIQGPIESGTSTACVHRIWCQAKEQKPNPRGVRMTRWAVVRNTYSELEETTLATWRMWMEDKVQGRFGFVTGSRPPVHHIKVPHPDGRTLIDCEVIFLALDVEEDVKKLMSWELTGAWVNEGQFVVKEIVDELESRSGRFPAKIDGGFTWRGVMIDLNAPPEGHWIPYMRGDVPLPLEWDDDQRAEFDKPEDWTFYVQPPGLIELVKNKQVIGYEENTLENRQRHKLTPVGAIAENAKWRQKSYLEVIQGKKKDWIEARVMNRVGLYKAGKPVHESFRPEFHIAETSLKYIPEFQLLVGLDFARNPAAIFGQNIRGQLQVLSELGAENVSAQTFAPMVKQHIADRYPEALPEADGQGVRFFGDPTGNSKGQGTDKTPYQIFLVNGMLVVMAPGNNSLDLRLNTVDMMLSKLAPNGGPMLLIDPGCRMLKTAMNGGYHFKKIQGQARHHDEPHKDHFADYADGLQYLALGAGFGVEAVKMPDDDRRRKKTRTRRRKFSLKRGVA